MDMKRLKKQMDFILEVDKVKNIMRQTYLADGKRKENDAEHSWDCPCHGSRFTQEGGLIENPAMRDLELEG